MTDLVYIWKTPYTAPQEALGLFTLSEAAEFLSTKEDNLVLELDSENHEINGFHVEWEY